MRTARALLLSLVSLALVPVACSKANPDSAIPDDRPVEPPASMAEEVTARKPPPGPTPAELFETRIAEALKGAHRRTEDKTRDVHRHPRETLEFFGVTPVQTVVELWPGGGWYTAVLAPLLRDEGTLIVTNFDLNGPADYFGTTLANELNGRFEQAPSVFDQVRQVTVTQDVKLGKNRKTKKVEVKSIAITEFELAPAGTVDTVLTFRNSHGWYENGNVETVYRMAFKALKPGGVLGVVQHRAAEGADAKKTAPDGYLPEAAVVAAAEAVGFELAERSEINANPADTRDYKKGVWTLPPRLIEGKKKRALYEGIGESDRMTLKFTKPE